MRKRLILFLTPYSNPQKNAIAATLAWIAKSSESNLEVYYEAYHSGKHFHPTSVEDYFGSTVLGGFHHQRLCLLNAHFDIEFIVYGEPKVFSSHLKNTEANIVVETKDLIELYLKVFSHYKIEFPEEVVILKTSFFDLGDGTSRNIVLPNNTLRPNIDVSPYCYPEIFYRCALGVGAPVDMKSLRKLYSTRDPVKLYTLFVADKKVEEIKNQGFNVEIIDKFQPKDTLWSVTNRITNRWLKYSKGIAYCDPVLASYWLPWLCRHDRLAVYESFMEGVREQLKDLILITGNKILYGRHSDDRDITELSKHGITFQIMDPCRPLFPIVEEIEYQVYRPEKSYFEFEPDDDTLNSFANERKILCTMLFYAPDIRHTEGLHRILDLAVLTKTKMGLGITAHWYKFVPEVLEMINVPLENGGVFPNVEPLLCSTGMGVCVEKFLQKELFRRHLKEARRIISEVAGDKCLPTGHYPFLDTMRDYPYSKSDVDHAEPSFDEVMGAGFEYSISYASPGKPKVIFKSDRFIAINFTTKHWFRHSPFIATSNPREIKKTEIGLALKRKPGWIIVALDSPLWAFSYHHWERGNKLLELASYISRGGMTGKLVNTTPHVISRYARILDDQGKL